MRLLAVSVLLIFAAGSATLALTTTDSEGGILWTGFLLVIAVGCVAAGIQLVRR